MWDHTKGLGPNVDTDHVLVVGPTLKLRLKIDKIRGPNRRK